MLKPRKGDLLLRRFKVTHKEYKRILNYEIFRFTDGKKLTLIKKIRYKYFTPNSNCVF